MAAVAVAELAVWLLRPRAPAPEPAPVEARAYFTEQQIERGEDFRGGQRLILLGTLAVEGGVLLLLALGRPRFARRALGRAGARPVAGAALAGAGISLALAVVTLPLGAAAHERSVDAGLSTQSFGAWLGDHGKAAAIGALLAGTGATALLALVRRFPRRWWIGAAAGTVALGAIFAWLAPVLLAPIFNRFEPLPPGKARGDVLELARRAGVDIGAVYRVDASRRSRALNAYVDGLGPTKRVVVYDNLLAARDRDVLRSVLAHELGHVKERDIQRGLLWLALVAPAAMLLVRELAGSLQRRTGVEAGTPASLPALALSLALVSLVLGSVSNQLSRRVETRADAYSLQLTRDPEGMIELQRRLTVSNVADPDPPEVLQLLLGTHPTTVERIGAALVFERQTRSARDPRSRAGS